MHDSLPDHRQSLIFATLIISAASTFATMIGSYRSWLSRFPVPLRVVVHAAGTAMVLIPMFLIVERVFGGGFSYAPAIVLGVVLGLPEVIDTSRYRKPLLVAWVIVSAIALPAVIVLGLLDTMESAGERVAWLLVVCLFVANLILSSMELRKRR